MKVLFYSHNYGASTTTFIRNEFTYLVNKIDCKYLCQDIANNADNPNVHVIPYKQNKLIEKINWGLWQYDIACKFRSREYSKKISSFLDEFSPDIIHCHFAYEALFLLDNIDVTKYKIILHFHGYDASQMVKKKSYVKRLKEFMALPNVSAISCNEYFIDTLAQFGIDRSKFTLLRYGIDINLFNPLSDKLNGRQEKKFLQISSLAEKKGHEFTLQAFAKLIHDSAKKNFSLTLTGDGDRRKKLEKLSHDLGVEEYVKFIGTVSPDKAVSLLGESDVFLHHSVTGSNGDKEGIPNAIMEAMAMELPVVSTYHSGIPELVEDGVNGYLVKEFDVAGYAQKMQAALEMGSLPQNREKINKFYNKESHNEILLNIYKNIYNS